jgi:hypothetical protein
MLPPMACASEPQTSLAMSHRNDGLHFIKNISQNHASICNFAEAMLRISMNYNTYHL